MNEHPIERLKIVAVALLLIAPAITNAAVVFQQTDKSVAVTTPTARNGFICIGGGVAANIGGVVFNVRNTTGSNLPIYVRIDEWSNSTCSSWNNKEWNNNGNVTVLANAPQADVEIPTPYEQYPGFTQQTPAFSSSKWYSFASYIGGSGLQFYGTSTANTSIYYKIYDTGGLAYHDVTGSINATTTWQSGQIYKISGNVTVNSGVTLTIQPGAIVKFDTATTSGLTVNGVLSATSSDEAIFFTSLRDDLVGGDTNGDATSTSPTAGDWRGITINSGGSANIAKVVIRYGGGASNAMIYNNGGTVTIDDSTVAYSAAEGIKTNAGTTTVTGSDVAFNTYGLYLSGGNISVSATSTIHDNLSYGAFNNTTATSSFFAEGNYWSTGTSTATSGPYHITLNPSGTGDSVSSYIDFDPWIGKSGTTSLPHYVITDSYAVQPNSCSVPYFASTTYSSLLTNAVNTWNNLPKIDLVATSSTSSIWTVYVSDVDRDDVSWRGRTIPGRVVSEPLYAATTTVELNSYYLDNDSLSSTTQKTVTHELGHVLGLNHSLTGNIMYAFAHPQTTIGDQDELDYDYQWSAETDWSNVCP